MTPLINDFIYFNKNYIPSEICNSIISDFEINQNQALIFNGSEHFSGTHERKDYSCRLSILNRELNQHINEKLTECLIEYMEHYSILKSDCLFFSPEIKVQKTPPGGGFHVWHFEDGSYENCDRELVWMIYLNDDFDGGETEFFYQKLRVIPEKGSILIWPADFTHTHRGNMVLGDKNKYICTGWLNRIPNVN
jgi:hypothetical protein